MSWIIYGLLSAATAALVAIFGKVGMQSIDPLIATTLRAAIMTITLLSASGVFKKVQALPTISPFAWLFIALSAVAGALSWLCYFSALQAGPATQVVALDRLSIVFTALLSMLFLGEQLTLVSGIGLILMVTGSWLLVK